MYHEFQNMLLHAARVKFIDGGARMYNMIYCMRGEGGTYHIMYCVGERMYHMIYDMGGMYSMIYYMGVGGCTI